MNSNGTAVHADVLVLGFGKGGKTAAAQLGRLGKRVVLVEQSERMYGGTCPNVGCVPSKGMVHHSGLRRPDDPPQPFYARAVADVQAVREFMRAGNRDAIDAMETVELITGHATFVDPHTVRVEVDGQQRTITADTILLNTGSEPSVPDIPGLRESSRTMTSTQLLESPVLPERLVILGAGAIGIELAQVYRHFGSAVTLLGARPRLLPEQDEDVAAAVHEILAGDGIRVETGARVMEVRDAAGGAVVVYEQDGARRGAEADVVLVAVGRSAATRGLGLDAAGVRTTDAGRRGGRRSPAHQPAAHLRAGRRQRRPAPHLHLARRQPHRHGPARREGGRSRADRVAVPQTLFMTPPLATVGLTERQAREAGQRIEIAAEPVADIIAMPRPMPSRRRAG